MHAAVDVGPVACPCCKGTLYLAQRSGEAGRSLWVSAAGTPQVKAGAKAGYITCQQCFKPMWVAVAREGRVWAELRRLSVLRCN